MTRGAVVCLAVMACSPPPPPAAPKPMTAAEILAGVDSTYAKVDSYSDRGHQSAAFLNTLHPHTQRRTFETAFVRNQTFRFEYLVDGTLSEKAVIWSTPQQTLTSWSVKPGVEQVESLGRALGTFAGVSGGLTAYVPPLLVPGLGFTSLTALTDVRRGPDEAVDGHACWKITGGRRDIAVTLWVDMQTHLIRQIEQQYRVKEPSGSGFDVDELTRYEPSIDTQLDIALLQPPDNHGQPPRVPAEPAWLGVMFEGHSGTTRVQSVVSGGPAEHAGVQPGDVITKIDTQPVAKAADVITRVRGEKVGTKLHVTVSRGGKELPLDVTLEKRPDLEDLQGRLVGHPAPDFALATLSGPASAKLDDLKGHVVIVDFWATWCGPCAMAMPHLVDLGHKYKDLRVVGVSDEDEADIKQYVADHKIDYTIARDPDDVVTGHYLVTGLPTLVIIDKTGVVRALHIGAGDFDAIEAEIQQYSK